MGNIIIYIILAIVIGGAVWGTVRRIRHGSSCCGEHDAAPKKVKVADTNKAHYSQVYELSIDGMHCANCARRIENAFNRNDGLWARADISQKRVELRSKRELSEDQCRSIVTEAGYTLNNMSRSEGFMGE